MSQNASAVNYYAYVSFAGYYYGGANRLFAANRDC